MVGVWGGGGGGGAVGGGGGLYIFLLCYDASVPVFWKLETVLINSRGKWNTLKKEKNQQKLF